MGESCGALGQGLTCIHCFTGDGAAHMQQACDQQSPLVCMKQEGELATTQTPCTHVGFHRKYAMGLHALLVLLLCLHATC